MRVILIRHGATAGNLEKKYIGKTDEPLCPEGIKAIEDAVRKNIYPPADKVAASPMLRCLQTASIIYPEARVCTEPRLAECDFGIFEGKNFEQLADEPLYSRWVESGGNMRFPGGELPSSFRARCVEGFFDVLKECFDEKNMNGDRFAQASSINKTLAVVAHGGTIMSVMSYAAGGEYFDYSCRNGSGYICDFKFGGDFENKAAERSSNAESRYFYCADYSGLGA